MDKLGKKQHRVKQRTSDSHIATLSPWHEYSPTSPGPPVEQNVLSELGMTTSHPNPCKVCHGIPKTVSELHAEEDTGTQVRSMKETLLALHLPWETRKLKKAAFATWETKAEAGSSESGAARKGKAAQAECCMLCLPHFHHVFLFLA